MLSCPQCGVAVTLDEFFCGNCGSQLQSQTAVPHAPGAEGGAVHEMSEEQAKPVTAAREEPVSSPQGVAEMQSIRSAVANHLANGDRLDAPVEKQVPDVSAVSVDREISPASEAQSVQFAVANDFTTGERLDAPAENQVPDVSLAPVDHGPAVAVSWTPSVQSADAAASSAEQSDAPAASQNSDTSAAAVDRATRAAETTAGAAAAEDTTPETPPSAAKTERHHTGGHHVVVKQLDGGTVLNNRYEIVRRIGGGGMGAVYLAKDRNLGDAPRAVKEMVETHLDEAQHEKAIGDFKRESLLLTSLEHPSIPTIYDYFYDGALGRFYLVMKYISGGDLASRLRNAHGGRVDEKTVTDWGMQVSDVLEYLHSRPKPIIYRDLKPANLMIDGNSGRVMLIDFGIARWVAKQEKGVTAVGTMGYAPPELFSGRVEPRSDVYSLGATMFHLMTGSDPQDNPLLIFDFGKNPRPRQIAPGLSAEMERILMRAVEYKPEDRFRSAGELRDVLAEHLEKLMSGRVNFGVPPVMVGNETVQVQTVFCGFCGGRIAVDDIFCAHCGAKQPLAAMAASAALQAARPTAKLVVAGTTELDSSFVLQKDSNLVGRADPHSNIFPEVDLSRFDPETKVSRRHARIWSEGDTFLVEDLGSVNGTVINDSVRLAPRQPRVLDSGDKIRLGETTLHFLLG